MASSPLLPLTPVRALVEFEDYTSYFGTRLYPQVGNLSLLGVGFILAFGVLDWVVTNGKDPFWLMLADRILASLVLGAAVIILKRNRMGWGPARATLYLGILSFLFLTVNYVVFTHHLEIVAFSMVFFFFGVHSLAPLLKLSEYIGSSILCLLVVGTLMEIPDLKGTDYALAGLFAIPLQVFLGAALVAVQRASREQYELARQNFLFSSLDTMTQLLNRRTWYEHTESCLRERRSNSESVAFLMVDIDHFKRFNDTWGHDCGDAVIQAVSATLIVETRSSDVVGRLGGEEFGILLPETNGEGASEIAERIRLAVQGKTVLYRNASLEVTVSIGVAVVQAATVDLEKLIKKGDLGLYQAKRNGRNRVVVAELS